jgi:hypothetical protein
MHTHDVFCDIDLLSVLLRAVAVTAVNLMGEGKKSSVYKNIIVYRTMILGFKLAFPNFSPQSRTNSAA